MRLSGRGAGALLLGAGVLLAGWLALSPKAPLRQAAGVSAPAGAASGRGLPPGPALDRAQALRPSASGAGERSGASGAGERSGAFGAGERSGASGAAERELAPLRVELVQEGEASFLRWELSNRASEPIYVAARWRGRRAAEGFDRVLRGATLHLTRRAWRVPSGLCVTAPEVPLYGRLNPGEVYRGRLELSPVLRLEVPFGPAGPGGAVEEVVLSLAYLVESEAPQLVEVQPGSNLFGLDHDAAIALQRSARAAPVAFLAAASAP